VSEHKAEEFSLAQLAAQAGLSKFHFQRLFKAAAGVSPSHYQIDPADKMKPGGRLRETKMSVIDVALKSAYNGPQPFRAPLPQRRTGLTPSEYRRQR